jgi:hypothetical protein
LSWRQRHRARRKPPRPGRHDCDPVPAPRLAQIFVDTKPPRHETVELDIGAISQNDHLDVRRADSGQIVERFDRVVLEARHVDEQDTRRGLVLERADGGADAAATDRYAAELVGQATAQR